MARGLNKVLDHLQRALTPAGESPTDGQLLARFVAARDEAAFAALVRRHGPMVLGVCRRLLRHQQDAEDAFQATFLVLARKAAAVRGPAVGGWLYAVAYRTALAARSANARRRSRERQVEDMPHPEAAPEEARDWRPWLDHELNLLPEKYRAVIVACDLEGRSRREAARDLGLSEGTLSSRLARARCLLAKRLSRHGLALSGGALAAAVAGGAASARVPETLLASATRVAVGRAVVSSSVEVLAKGAMQTMLLAKLKVAVGGVMVVVALGAGGLAYRATAQPAPAPAERKPDGKPRSELEALRHENELLKLNLEVVLEKVRAQEAELRTLRGQTKAAPAGAPVTVGLDNDDVIVTVNDVLVQGKLITGADDLRTRKWKVIPPDPLCEAEAALKALREAPDPQSRQRAADRLDGAVKALREQLKKQEDQRGR